MTQTAPETEALIERLRKDAMGWDVVDAASVAAPTTALLERDAANALQALSAKVAELEGENGRLRSEMAAMQGGGE